MFSVCKRALLHCPWKKKIDYSPRIFYFSEIQYSISLSGETSPLAQTNAKNNTHVCMPTQTQPLAVAPSISQAN